MNMERSVGSGGVLKKKGSSGCLIIKKKGEFNNNSGGGSGGLTVNYKEKKRATLVASVSASSDDNDSLEFMRRTAIDKRLCIGSMGYSRNEVENSEYYRNNIRMETSGERKRSRLDLYDFDEYDEFDGVKMRNEYMEDRFKMVERTVASGNLKEIGVDSSNRNLAMEKRKHESYFDGSSSGRPKGVGSNGLWNKGYEMEDDESLMPISMLKLKYQDKANQAIRLQGKNGVLKVMVNKKTKIDSPPQHTNIFPKKVEERRVSESKTIYQGSKPPEKLGVLVRKSKNAEKERKEAKSGKEKPVRRKGYKARDLEIEGSDAALKLAAESLEASRTRKVVKELEKSPVPENATPDKPTGGKEVKPKHGGSTEKQMLRERIREILVNAGWTIEYRPRRNRDYLDAIYINTKGTTYWSIIKAYDAYKKQLEEENGKSKQELSSPSPLPDSLIHKLTRRTRKKIEEETKRKRKEANLAKSSKKSVVRDSSESSDSDQNEDRKLKKLKSEKTPLPENSNALQGRTSKIIGRCTFLVLGSDKAKELEPDGFVPYTGKRTLLGWLIDSGTAHLSGKLQYMNRKRTRVMLEGWITRDGIHCGCCSKVLTVSKFELHAGSKLRQPFQNIFLESGASLLQCQIDAWNKQEETVRRDFHVVNADGDDPDDDTCGICGDGGDLICCDSCSSTFHQTCLEIQMLPLGDWHCSNCTCKFCGDAENASEGNDSSVKQLIRCSFCEMKYHDSCSEKVSALPDTLNGTSFCGLKCQELYDHLQKILGVKHELEAGYSWSIIQRSDVSDASHRSYHQRVESNSKLAVALSVMDECFMPIFDRRSGINMINSVVYNCGSNFNRLNYRGFRTVILEQEDEIISAACIRIHGTHLAEMPFIGTRDIYRRQGMCRRLLSAIETVLSSLKIGNLIIPAIPEHMDTWTMVFGFHELEKELKKEIKSMNMLVFPGTDMLQKPLLKQETSDVMEVKVSESVKEELNFPEKSDIDSSTVHNRQVIDDSGACPDTKTNDESDDGKAANPSDSVCESNPSLSSKETDVVKSESENNEIELLNSTMKDDVNYSVEASDNAQKFEASCPKFICVSSDKTKDASEEAGIEKPSASDNEHSLMKVAEETTPKLIINNASVESSSGAVSETSAQNIITSKLDGENIESLSQALVQLKPELNVPSEIHSSVEPSLDSDNGKCNGFSVTKENGEVSVVQLSSNSSLVQVSENEDNVQILNENQNPALLSSVSGEEVQVKDELVEIQSPFDKLDEKFQSPSDKLDEEIQSPSDKLNEEIQLPSDKLNEEIQLPSDTLDEEIQLASDKLDEQVQLPSDKLNEEIQLPSDKLDEEIQLPSDKLDEEIQLPSAFDKNVVSPMTTSEDLAEM